MLNSVFIRRLVAFAMDSIYYFPSALLIALLSDSYKTIGLIVIPVTFILRDIFTERSLGKTIFGLYIIDKNTGKPASTKQKIIRNLFCFIYVIDGFFLLAKGESIADRVTNTIVSTCEPSLYNVKIAVSHYKKSSKELYMNGATLYINENEIVLKSLFKKIAIFKIDSVKYRGLADELPFKSVELSDDKKSYVLLFSKTNYLKFRKELLALHII